MLAKKLLVIGYHDRESPRHISVCDAYRKEGWEVVECHTSKTGFFAKIRDLSHQYRPYATNVDAVLVTFPGHFLLPVVWTMTRRPRKKVFFDAFISLYDSDILDRARWPRWHPRAWILWWIDILSTHIADVTIVDTEQHREYFIERFRLAPHRVNVIALQTRADIFHPQPDLRRKRAPGDRYEILFCGTCIPLQGVEIIAAAARLLHERKTPVHFTFVGPRKLHVALEGNVPPGTTFAPFATLQEVARYICSADLCLGIFGTTEKARRVVPHKVIDSVACGIPVLTANTQPIVDRYAHNALVHTCPAGNPAALADAISLLLKI